ncbi:NDR1/HIN1-like protein 13 [Malania oleifera]|uniref:NDR1/HIN1-like protein 13 n=1 Tax=Malania oleifera TaxID=397392 RepID=UPI0025AE14E4|nr:NDR1/HIN1-like protein 13 [Malania oleifera]
MSLPMEERPATHVDDDHPPPLEPPPAHHLSSETYVVQVPKDQIYRIPPPENAQIVETYRNPAGRPKNAFSSRWRWILVGVAAVALAVTIAFGLYSIILSPQSPTFSVEHVIVKDPQPSPNKKWHPQFEISLLATNPNSRMGIYYERDGRATLSFKEKQIATGEFPAFFQESKNSRTVPVVVAGSGKDLPHEVQERLKDKNSTAVVSLGFMVEAPVRMKAGAVQTRGMEMTIECELKVKKLATGGRPLSAHCDTKLKN